MDVSVLFYRDPEDDIEVIKAGRVPGHTMLQKQMNLLKQELDQCKEIKGTFTVFRHDSEGSCFIVVFKVVGDHRSHEADSFMVQLLQYGYARYLWAGSFSLPVGKR